MDEYVILENFIPVAKVGEQEKLLQEKSEGDIIKRKWDESEHPSDDKGLFVNKGFTKQTLFLPKEEYANVLQEINNIYHLRFEDKTEGHIELFMDDDIYVFLFEIKEYNDYNIYDKINYWEYNEDD